MASKSKASLADLDAPEWFAQAASELKPVRKTWAKRLPVIILRDGSNLPEEAFAWILSAMVYMEAEAIRHDVVDLLKRHADPASLDAWMAATFTAWVEAAAPERDSCVLSVVGYLGGDITVRYVRDAVRAWTREKQRALAVRGVDALGRIGTKAALEEVSVLSAGLRDHTVVDTAQHVISRKAENQGTSRDEMEDRLVAKYGLNERGEQILSYGPRTFCAILGKDLNLALYDADGRKRKSLPPISATDDRAIAEQSRADWAEMRTGISRVVKAQLKRFDQAMITGRSWSVAEFQQNVLAHPIVSRIAQLLVWQTVPTGGEALSLRVTEDLTFANVSDETVSLAPDQQLRVAHPLRLSADELKGWIALFSDYRFVQPMQQLARQVYLCNPAEAGKAQLDAPKHTPLKAGALYGVLDNDGWRLGPVVEGRFSYSWKSFLADDVTAVISYSGLIAGLVGKSPDQVISGCTFYSGVVTSEQKNPTGKCICLGQVPAVAFSETMRRLLRITADQD